MDRNPAMKKAAPGDGLAMSGAPDRARSPQKMWRTPTAVRLRVVSPATAARLEGFST